MTRTKIIVFLIEFCLIISLSGCAAVQPWERGNLAKQEMAFDLYPQQSMYRSHNYGSREGSAGGSAAASGGGCGCY